MQKWVTFQWFDWSKVYTIWYLLQFVCSLFQKWTFLDSLLWMKSCFCMIIGNTSPSEHSSTIVISVMIWNWCIKIYKHFVQHRQIESSLFCYSIIQELIFYTPSSKTDIVRNQSLTPLFILIRPVSYQLLNLPGHKCIDDKMLKSSV